MGKGDTPGRPQHVDHEKMRVRAEALGKLRTNLEVETVDTAIRRAVKKAWKATHHDAELTALLLDISRSTLYRYLNRYKLDRWT